MSILPSLLEKADIAIDTLFSRGKLSTKQADAFVSLITDQPDKDQVVEKVEEGLPTTRMIRDD